ncbi:M56 family metallopeptidase [Paenibacillus silagei]|uniref:Beta-lactamase regulating signal transducer with metallopeptidase domain n=1 Tax=Paenibacillus silagei TaxID=1670801 RepID=A0ABS4NMB3_9BACL|nr:M56 family metallopeptidase [Paenibacillus silagei]MBP2111210.1 beta-lactamase regulating signal transducer with metallopeptidase domain [Paenibacillus silagei]
MTMNTLLNLLISLTAAGSVVTISIYALGRFSTGHFPARWRYGLIKLSLVFYLIPIALILRWLSQHLSAPRVVTSVQNPQSGRVTGIITESLQHAALTLTTSTAYILLGIWAAGAIIFAAWQGYAYRRFTRVLKRNRTMVPENSEPAKMLRSIKEELGLTCSVKLAYSSVARSPFLAGLWRPSIYLPIQSHANLDMEMVLRHELVHLKRKDLWIKAALLVVRTLHWYNPLVHTVRHELHTWSELTCDQEVVQEMSHADRKRYGGTILNVMAGPTSQPGAFYASLSGDGKQLQRRLTHMLNVKKLNRQTLFLSVTAALLIAGIGTSTAALASKMTPQVVADSEYTSSDNAASEIAASTVPEGKITEPAKVSGTQPAESSTIPAQKYKAGQLVAGPAESDDSATVPAEQSPGSAQAEIIAQPLPELVPAPAEGAPVTMPKASAVQSDSGLAPAPVPDQKEANVEALPELVPAPAEIVPAPAK